MALFVTLAAVVGLTLAFIEGHHEAATEAERDKPSKAPTRVETVAGENVVTLDAATQTTGAIALAPLPSISHRAEVVAYGSVLDIGELTDLQKRVYRRESAARESECGADGRAPRVCTGEGFVRGEPECLGESVASR